MPTQRHLKTMTTTACYKVTSKTTSQRLTLCRTKENLRWNRNLNRTISGHPQNFRICRRMHHLEKIYILATMNSNKNWCCLPAKVTQKTIFNAGTLQPHINHRRSWRGSQKELFLQLRDNNLAHQSSTSTWKETNLSLKLTTWEVSRHMTYLCQFWRRLIQRARMIEHCKSRSWRLIAISGLLSSAIKAQCSLCEKKVATK